MASTELIEFLPDTCSPQPVPHTYGCIGTRNTYTIPSTYGFDLPADFGTTNATDTYFHAIDDLANGITYFYPPATTNPTTATVCTNVAGIQAFLNNINSGITYNVNAFNEIVLTFTTAGDETRWSFWLGTSTFDGYTNKLIPTLHDLQVDTQTYQQVQVVKSQQADGTFIDKFFIPSGNTLVEVNLKPENTFKFGNCPDCKNEVFATHDRFIVVPAIPPGYVAYEMTTTLASHGWDATNSYLHLIYGIVNNATPNPPIGGQLNDYFANTQPGIIFTDVVTIQAIVDFVLPQMGLSVGDAIYAVNTDNEPIWFLSPAMVAEIANGTYLHIYFGDTDVWNSYNDRANVTNIAVNPNIFLGGFSESCAAIQEIKERNSCTGEETYRYVIENGNGILVPVKDIYPFFDETNVLIKCPEYIYETKEVCGKIDGGTACYEIIKVNKRNKDTWEIISSYYESKTGLKLSTVEEVCCTCDCLCTIGANRIGFSYATLFNGRDVLGDRIVGGTEMFIEYLEVDGSVIINSQTSIGTTTGGFTSVDMGYGLAYNKIVDLLNSNSYIQNANLEFVTSAYPNNPYTYYDPMQYGLKYNNAKDVRLVLSERMVSSTAVHVWSIRTNSNNTETYDALYDARTAPSWAFVDVVATGPAQNLFNIAPL